jgi:hypothetical protein
MSEAVFKAGGASLSRSTFLCPVSVLVMEPLRTHCLSHTVDVIVTKQELGGHGGPPHQVNDHRKGDRLNLLPFFHILIHLFQGVIQPGFQVVPGFAGGIFGFFQLLLDNSLFFFELFNGILKFGL